MGHPIALLAALVLVVGSGCQATVPPTPGPTTPATAAPPSGPAVLGLDWGRATAVERPANYQETVPPNFPGVHPILTIPGQATMADVVARPDGGFVAVGYSPPEWLPLAWTSRDGLTWTIHEIGTTDFTFPVSLAHGAGTLVAVGRSGKAPVAWTSSDGAEWHERTIPSLGDDGVAERMTTVVAGSSGFVAGGSVGPELLDRHARFWTSADGTEWLPVPDDPTAFADAEVRAIVAFDGGFVAVGVVGTVQAWTGAVAWTSPDGRNWTRVEDEAFADGVAVSVSAAPFGGLIAVGSDLERRNAVAWISSDGRDWTRAPDEPSRQHTNGYAWLTDVAAIDDEVIAVGDIQGLQRGTAMAWVSSDGLQWQRSNRAPVQEGAEFYAVIAGGPGAIAIGAFGAPDSYVPEVWVSPGR